MHTRWPKPVSSRLSLRHQVKLFEVHPDARSFESIASSSAITNGNAGRTVHRPSACPAKPIVSVSPIQKPFTEAPQLAGTLSMPCILAIIPAMTLPA
jgi:hypothetical protein